MLLHRTLLYKCHAFALAFQLQAIPAPYGLLFYVIKFGFLSSQPFAASFKWLCTIYANGTCCRTFRNSYVICFKWSRTIDENGTCLVPVYSYIPSSLNGLILAPSTYHVIQYSSTATQARIQRFCGRRGDFLLFSDPNS